MCAGHQSLRCGCYEVQKPPCTISWAVAPTRREDPGGGCCCPVERHFNTVCCDRICFEVSTSRTCVKVGDMRCQGRCLLSHRCQAWCRARNTLSSVVWLCVAVRPTSEPPCDVRVTSYSTVHGTSCACWMAADSCNWIAGCGECGSFNRTRSEKTGRGLVQVEAKRVRRIFGGDVDCSISQV